VHFAQTAILTLTFILKQARSVMVHRASVAMALSLLLLAYIFILFFERAYLYVFTRIADFVSKLSRSKN